MIKYEENDLFPLKRWKPRAIKLNAIKICTSLNIHWYVSIIVPINAMMAALTANTTWGLSNLVYLFFIFLSPNFPTKVIIKLIQNGGKNMELLLIPAAIVFIAMFIHAVNDISKVKEELELVKKQNEEILELLSTQKNRWFIALERKASPKRLLDKSLRRANRKDPEFSYQCPSPKAQTIQWRHLHRLRTPCRMSERIETLQSPRIWQVPVRLLFPNKTVFLPLARARPNNLRQFRQSLPKWII